MNNNCARRSLNALDDCMSTIPAPFFRNVWLSFLFNVSIISLLMNHFIHPSSITQAHQTQGHSLRSPNSRLSQAAHVATSNAWAICDHDLHPPLEPPHLRCNAQNQKNRQGKLFSSKFLGSSVFWCPKKTPYVHICSKFVVLKSPETSAWKTNSIDVTF